MRATRFRVGTSVATSLRSWRPNTQTEWRLTPHRALAFPRDIKPAPRSYAEAFVNVVEFSEHDAGGHFAAWEQPHAYADDLRRAVKLG
jgi:hypothetical protein